MVVKGSSEIQNIWAFDPGVGCGWVVYSVVEGVLGAGEPKLAGDGAGGLRACIAMLDEIWQWARGIWPDFIVYEGFTLRPAKTDVGYRNINPGLSPVYVMAWIKMNLVLSGYEGRWKEQFPGQRTVVPNKVLKELGWFLPGGGGHRHDAMRHLVVFLRGNGLEVRGR